MLTAGLERVDAVAELGDVVLGGLRDLLVEAET